MLCGYLGDKLIYWCNIPWQWKVKTLAASALRGTSRTSSNTRDCSTQITRNSVSPSCYPRRGNSITNNAGTKNAGQSGNPSRNEWTWRKERGIKSFYFLSKSFLKKITVAIIKSFFDERKCSPWLINTTPSILLPPSHNQWCFTGTAVCRSSCTTPPTQIHTLL